MGKSKATAKYIKEANTIDTLSALTKRGANTLRKRQAEYAKQTKEEDKEFIEQLHSKHYWPATRSKLLEHEIIFFENEWAALIKQFSTHDVLHTDEIMIQDLIMETIMVNRNLERQRDVQVAITNLRLELQNSEMLPTVERDFANEARMRNELTSLMAASQSLIKEHSDLQNRKDVLFKSLKATREQRYKQLEAASSNFFERIKQLDTLESRQKEGRWMEMMAEAAAVEYKRLTEYHEYVDGEVDIPILTPEVVESLQEEQERIINESDQEE